MPRTAIFLASFSLVLMAPPVFATDAVVEVMQPEPDRFACVASDECRPVISYKPPESESPGKTILSCLSIAVALQEDENDVSTDRPDACICKEDRCTPR